jgi:hypothetical protein
LHGAWLPIGPVGSTDFIDFTLSFWFKLKNDLFSNENTMKLTQIGENQASALSCEI